MFNSILVPIDLEHAETYDDALSTAVDTAKRENARLHLVTVVHRSPAIVSNYLPEGYEAETSVRAQEALGSIAEGLDVDGTVACHVRYGDVYPEILSVAKEIQADLIVIESHRPGVSDYLLGTTAARVVRHAECSVLVLRTDNR